MRKEFSQSHLSDGAIDFGNGVIGPSDADIKYFNSLRESPEQQLIRQAGKLLTQENLIPISRESRLGEFINHFIPKFPRWALVPAAGIISLAAAGCSDARIPLGNSDVPATPTSSGSAASPRPADWYLTAGPHIYEGPDSIGAINTIGIRDAIDLSPRGSEGKTCPTDPITTAAFPSPVEGQVVLVGDENNRNDPKHSEVIIRLKDGTQIGLMHLANIKVMNGQTIKPGDPIAFASCEVPGEGGFASSPHVHIFAEDEQGKAIPMEGVITNLGIVHADPRNYYGAIQKSDGSLITADTGRCGPDKASIDSCGGKRNSIEGFLQILQVVQKGKLIFNLRYANGSPVLDSQIDLYKQEKDINGEATINSSVLKESSTGKTGAANFDVPPGPYVLLFSEYSRNKIFGPKFNPAVSRPGVADVIVSPNQTTTKNFALGMLFIHFIEDPKNPARNPYTNQVCVSGRDDHQVLHDILCMHSSQLLNGEQVAVIDLVPADNYETIVSWDTAAAENVTTKVGPTPLKEGQAIELWCVTDNPRNRTSKEAPGCSTTAPRK